MRKSFHLLPPEVPSVLPLGGFPHVLLHRIREISIPSVKAPDGLLEDFFYSRRAAMRGSWSGSGQVPSATRILSRNDLELLPDS